jgi:uncharacterized protein YndB with AHSA1/START domain
VSVKAGDSGAVTRHVDAPPDVVYRVVSDVTRMGEWSPQTVSCEWIEPSAAPEEGARFRAHNRRGRMRWSNKPIVTVADPSHEFAFRRRASGSDVTWRYQLTPAGDGTDVTESFEVHRPSPRALMWIFNRVDGVTDRQADLEENIRQSLERLARVVENEPRGT